MLRKYLACGQEAENIMDRMKVSCQIVTLIPRMRRPLLGMEIDFEHTLLCHLQRSFRLPTSGTCIGSCRCMAKYTSATEISVLEVYCLARRRNWSCLSKTLKMSTRRKVFGLATTGSCLSFAA